MAEYVADFLQNKTFMASLPHKNADFKTAPTAEVALTENFPSFTEFKKKVADDPKCFPSFWSIALPYIVNCANRLKVCCEINLESTREVTVH